MDDNTLKELSKKLNPEHVKKHPFSGCDYIEGWRAIEEANRIFGHDGWWRETVELIENTSPTQNAKDNFIVSFRAKVKITVGGVVRHGIGFGNGIDKDIHSAYEGAIKEAETDAMKRALMTFGYPFGLALYDKDKKNVGIDLTPEQEKAREVASVIQKHIKEIRLLTSDEAVSKYLKSNPIEGMNSEQASWLDAQIKGHIEKIKGGNNEVS